MAANSNPPPPPLQRISVDEMRQRFNESGYWENVKSGKWTAVILEQRRSGALPQETVEIKSIMLSYQDENGNEMARVHQYERPDKSIAASGLPDPKRMFKDGILFRLKKGG
jgi:hypothetical protein